MSLDVSKIIVATTASLAGFEILEYKGIVTSNMSDEDCFMSDEEDMERMAIDELKEKALKVGANAVVGINISAKRKRDSDPDCDFYHIFLKAVGTAVLVKKTAKT